MLSKFESCSARQGPPSSAGLGGRPTASPPAPLPATTLRSGACCRLGSVEGWAVLKSMLRAGQCWRACWGLGSVEGWAVLKSVLRAGQCWGLGSVEERVEGWAVLRAGQCFPRARQGWRVCWRLGSVEECFLRAGQCWGLGSVFRGLGRVEECAEGWAVLKSVFWGLGSVEECAEGWAVLKSVFWGLGSVEECVEKCVEARAVLKSVLMAGQYWRVLNG